jgi:carboxymethylenebutenolidase
MLAEIDTRGVQSSMVQCANGMDAFLALPEGSGPHPSVVLLHERYGLLQHTKDLAVRFATEGYATVCPNLFHREPNQAEIASGNARAALSDDLVVDDVNAAIAHLGRVPNVSTERIIAMGVCATGRHPLVVAARREDVQACVVFYGGAGNPRPGQEPLEEVIKRSRAPVLGVFGEGDHGISLDHVHAFRRALEQARRSYHIRIAPDAPHGFLNDTMPGRYRREQAEVAWELLMDFLKRVRSGGYPPDRARWAFEGATSANYDFSKNVRYE